MPASPVPADLIPYLNLKKIGKKWPSDEQLKTAWIIVGMDWDGILKMAW